MIVVMTGFMFHVTLLGWRAEPDSEVACRVENAELNAVNLVKLPPQT
jgi:hypothetical protein